MTCYHPLKAWRTPQGVVFSELSRYDIIGRCDVPCGRCLGCRLRRSREWAVRVMHEAQMWRENCFVTLTYSEEHLSSSSLVYSDYQSFMRRLRRYRPGVRFFMCGEYGPLKLRPHFHACLFNVDFRDGKVRGKSASGAVFLDSPVLAALWQLGNVSVQPLNFQTASYCARYIVDKVTGDDAEVHYSSVDADGVIVRRVPEFSHCSLKPGIGANWLKKYGGDVYPHDFVVQDGLQYSPPKYYDKLARRGDVDWDRVEYARQKRALAAFADNTEERLRVREVVHMARVSKQKRGLG